MVTIINDKDYKEYIKEGKVVIDCFANWCGPCKMISPVLDKLSEENENTKFYKIDVDQATEIVRDYEIMSIPTLLIFENGTLKEKVVGLRSKTELEELIK